MRWCVHSPFLTDRARKSGQFIDRKSKIGLRPDGTEFVKLGKLDWEIQRQRVIERDRWKCHGCGAVLNECTADVDHIRSRGRGGDDSLRNLRLLGNRFSACKCHVLRHPRVRWTANEKVQDLQQGV